MKILAVNTSDSGGAARAALRLHDGLLRLGVDSTALLQSKTREHPGVVGQSTPWAGLAGLFRRHLDALPLRLYRTRPFSNFSSAMVGAGLCRRVHQMDPDVVHLHWLGTGFVRLESLRALRRPLVWTLHDSWAFTGGCHVPFDCHRYQVECGRCPVLGSDCERDLSHWVWRRKSRVWRELDLTVVCPSRWLAECARASSLFRGSEVHLIPNGIDTEVFQLTNSRLARSRLGLPADRRIVLFGAFDGTTNRNKGFDLLVAALQGAEAKRWKGGAELVVFGSTAPATPPPVGTKVRYRGVINDDATLALLYSAADVFVVPSRLENLPNTVMESMSCGTPCVAFRQGGVPDLIQHEKTGYLAEGFDPEDLAAGISWVLEDENRRSEISERCRREVREKFALEVTAAHYREVYRAVATRKGRRGDE